VTIGVALGLLVGKLVGITGAVALATRFRLGRLPDGVTFGQVVGLSLLAGIGFTVSLFISGLAFSDPTLEAEAKLGILAISVVAAVAGSLVLRASLPRRSP
jgi:Na+/H+ antiporter NhaA